MISVNNLKFPFKLDFFIIGKNFTSLKYQYCDFWSVVRICSNKFEHEIDICKPCTATHEMSDISLGCNEVVERAEDDDGMTGHFPERTGQGRRYHTMKIQ